MALELFAENVAEKCQKVVPFWKLLGGILLIVGTSIGGGMLALPITTAKAGFIPSAIFLFFIWLMMSIGAFLMLEVNLWCPKGSNLITMVKSTLGRKAEVVTWLIYLLLLYCLLSAYISGGEALVSTLFSYAGIGLHSRMALFIFVGICVSIVCLGMRSVDLVNRLIMLTKILSFALIVSVTLPLVRTENLSFAQVKPLYATMTAMITAFGFSIIVPSLRDYFDGDRKKLRLALSIGCFIPLLCYFLWLTVIFGTIPFVGELGLAEITQATQPLPTLMSALVHISNQPQVIFAAKLFTSVCIVTAFLGVSVCLTDFLADGLNTRKKGRTAILIFLLSFVPPILLVLLVPQLFVYAISFAGVFCILLLILLPALMAVVGVTKQNKSIQFITKKTLPYLYGFVVVALMLLFWGLALNLIN